MSTTQPMRRRANTTPVRGAANLAGDGADSPRTPLAWSSVPNPEETPGSSVLAWPIIGSFARESLISEERDREDERLPDGTTAAGTFTTDPIQIPTNDTRDKIAGLDS